MTAEQQPNPFRPPGGSAPGAQPFPPPVVPPAVPSGAPVAAPATAAYGVPQQTYGAGLPVSYPGHPGHPAGPGWPQPYVPGPRNGLGTAALVLGIVGATLCWTFVLSPVTLVLGLLALIFGLVGAGRARRGAATNRVVALGGLWIGAGTTAISAVLTVVLLIWATDTVGVDSAAGSDYLAVAGEPVVFEDGLTVTFDEPVADTADATFILTANISNDGDEDADLGGDTFRAWTGDGGEEVNDRAIERGEVGETVEPGQTARVRFTVSLPAATEVLGVDYAPGTDHDFGYWEFDLPAGSGGGGGDGGDGSGSGGSVDV